MDGLCVCCETARRPRRHRSFLVVVLQHRLAVAFDQDLLEGLDRGTHPQVFEHLLVREHHHRAAAIVGEAAEARLDRLAGHATGVLDIVGNGRRGSDDVGAGSNRAGLRSGRGCRVRRA